MLMAAELVMANCQSPLSIGVAYFMLRPATTETLEFSFNYAVNKWWTSNRGRAMGILATVSSLEFLFPAVTTELCTLIGWRHTAMGLGFVFGGLAICCGSLIGEPPKQEVLAVDTKNVAIVARTDEVEYTLQEAMRTPMLWALFISRLLVGVPWAALCLFMTDFLVESGNSAGDMAIVSTAMTTFAVLTASLYGIIFDKLPHDKKHFTLACMSGAGFLTTMATAGLWFMPKHVGPIVVGCCLGNWVSTFMPNNAVIAHIFGVKSMGKISSLSWSFRLLASAVGPLMVTLLQKFGVETTVLLIALSSVQLVGVLLILLCPLPKQGTTSVARTEEVQKALNAAKGRSCDSWA